MSTPTPNTGRGMFRAGHFPPEEEDEEAAEAAVAGSSSSGGQPAIAGRRLARSCSPAPQAPESSRRHKHGKGPSVTQAGTNVLFWGAGALLGFSLLGFWLAPLAARSS